VVEAKLTTTTTKKKTIPRPRICFFLNNKAKLTCGGLFPASVADVEEEAKGRIKNSILIKNPPGGKSSGPFW